MTAIWRRLFIGWLVALAIAAGGIGPALAGPLEEADAAYERGDFATVLRLYRPLAEQGNATAQFSLGLMYENGDGVAKNHAEAVKWYRRAAEQGDANGQFLLGKMYEFGRGVAQDDAEAVKWYRLAAEQGDAESQSTLGFAYWKGGKNVAKNFVLAHMWFNVASRRGDANGVENRDTVAERMTPQQIAEAQKLAAEWKPKTWSQLKQQVPR